MRSDCIQIAFGLRSTFAKSTQKLHTFLTPTLDTNFLLLDSDLVLFDPDFHWKVFQDIQEHSGTRFPPKNLYGVLDDVVCGEYSCLVWELEANHKQIIWNNSCRLQHARCWRKKDLCASTVKELCNIFFLATKLQVYPCAHR